MSSRGHYLTTKFNLLGTWNKIKIRKIEITASFDMKRNKTISKSKKYVRIFKNNIEICTYWRLLEIWYVLLLMVQLERSLFHSFWTVFRLASAPPIIRLTKLELTIFFFFITRCIWEIFQLHTYSQRPRIDLNKRFLPTPNTATAYAP